MILFNYEKSMNEKSLRRVVLTPRRSISWKQLTLPGVDAPRRSILKNQLTFPGVNAPRGSILWKRLTFPGVSFAQTGYANYVVFLMGCSAEIDVAHAADISGCIENQMETTINDVYLAFRTNAIILTLILWSSNDLNRFQFLDINVVVLERHEQVNL